MNNAGRSSSSSEANGICASDCDPASAQQLHPGGPVGSVVEQRGLAYPRLPGQREPRADA